LITIGRDNVDEEGACGEVVGLMQGRGDGLEERSEGKATT